jgi:hypothetical protein
MNGFGATQTASTPVLKLNIPHLQEWVACARAGGSFDPKTVQCYSTPPSKGIPTWAWIAGGVALAGGGAYWFMKMRKH